MSEPILYISCFGLLWLCIEQICQLFRSAMALYAEAMWCACELAEAEIEEEAE